MRLWSQPLRTCGWRRGRGGPRVRPSTNQSIHRSIVLPISLCINANLGIHPISCRTVRAIEGSSIQPYHCIFTHLHTHTHTRALGHFRCLDIHAAHLHEPRSMDSWRTLDRSRFVRVRSLLVGARYRTRSHGWLLIHRRDQKGRTYRRYHQQRSARSLTRTACSPRSLVRR